MFAIGTVESSSMLCALMLASQLFHACHVDDGGGLACRGPYTGTAIVLVNGTYQECRLIRGEPMWCEAPPGDVTVPIERRKGEWELCHLHRGQIRTCSGTASSGDVVTPLY